jgi:hypothetical protein
MMNQEIKAQWVERLRSGEIEQTAGKLGTKDGKRCCLGVLCDLAAEAGVVKTEPNDIGYLVYLDSDEDEFGEQSVLPLSVQKWAGITQVNPWVKLLAVDEGTGEPYEANDTLASLNDAGRTFPEIADIIDAQL